VAIRGCSNCLYLITTFYLVIVNRNRAARPRPVMRQDFLGVRRRLTSGMGGPQTIPIV
jgi:hypothetical protein